MFTLEVPHGDAGASRRSRLLPETTKPILYNNSKFYSWNVIQLKLSTYWRKFVAFQRHIFTK